MKIEPIHPGEILLEEFMKPLNISQNALAKAILVSPRRVNEIVNKKRAITADTALRLSRYFGVSAEFWLNLQKKYELEIEKESSSKELIEKIAPYKFENSSFKFFGKFYIVGRGS